MNKNYARGLELALLQMEKAKKLDEAIKAVRRILGLVKESKYSYLIKLLEEIR